MRQSLIALPLNLLNFLPKKCIVIILSCSSLILVEISSYTVKLIFTNDIPFDRSQLDLLSFLIKSLKSPYLVVQKA